MVTHDILFQPPFNDVTQNLQPFINMVVSDLNKAEFEVFIFLSVLYHFPKTRKFKVSEYNKLMSGMAEDSFVLYTSLINLGYETFSCLSSSIHI